jgi:hypothetical protein
VPGEETLKKQPIPVHMAKGQVSLPLASRIYFGIIHPIQYNVKVREIGHVPADHVPALLQSWQDENQEDTPQAYQCINKNEERETNDNEIKNNELRKDSNLEKQIHYTQDERQDTKTENVVNKDLGTSTHASLPKRTDPTSHLDFLAPNMRVSSKDTGKLLEVRTVFQLS